MYLSKFLVWGYYYYEIFKNFYLKLVLLKFNVYFENSCNSVNVYLLLKVIVLVDLRDKYIFLLKKYVLD